MADLTLSRRIALGLDTPRMTRLCLAIAAAIFAMDYVRILSPATALLWIGLGGACLVLQSLLWVFMLRASTHSAPQQSWRAHELYHPRLSAQSRRLQFLTGLTLIAMLCAAVTGAGSPTHPALLAATGTLAVLLGCMAMVLTLLGVPAQLRTQLLERHDELIESKRHSAGAVSAQQI